MKIKTLAILTILFLLVNPPQTVESQGELKGFNVFEGAYVVYNASMKSQLKGVRSLALLNVTVKNISGTRVYLEFHYRFSDNTSTSFGHYTSVSPSNIDLFFFNTSNIRGAIDYLLEVNFPQPVNATVSVNSTFTVKNVTVHYKGKNLTAVEIKGAVYFYDSNGTRVGAVKKEFVVITEYGLLYYYYREEWGLTVKSSVTPSELTLSKTNIIEGDSSDENEGDNNGEESNSTEVIVGGPPSTRNPYPPEIGDSDGVQRESASMVNDVLFVVAVFGFAVLVVLIVALPWLRRVL